MFLTNHTTRRLATAMAAVLLLGATGCAPAGDRMPDTSPSPSRSVNFSQDPARVGDRSGNPSCEVAVDSAPQLRWRQVHDLRLDTDLPLAPDVNVHAVRRGAAWDLRITAPGGRSSTHRVSEDVVHLAFDRSCFRRLYRLREPVTVYSDWIGDRSGPVRIGAGEELVVTDAGTWLGGKLTWTVDHNREPEYAVFADELKRAGTPSDDVPIGFWRDDPNTGFFQLQGPLKTRSGDTLRVGTRISMRATSSCGATRADDVLGFALYPRDRLNGYAEARRGDLLAVLDLGRILEPKTRDSVTGVNESSCPKERP